VPEPLTVAGGTPQVVTEVARAMPAEVEHAATVLVMYGRWWVKGVEEQATHPHVRRSIASDPVYFGEMTRDARNRGADLGGEHVHKVEDAIDIIRQHQEARRGDA
jgi:hypothetical protein